MLVLCQSIINNLGGDIPMIHLLLGKSELQKLALFSYLEKTPSHKELKEVIIKELNISEFLLNKIIKELNLDINRYQLSSKFSISTTNLFTKLNIYNNFSSDKLKYIYTKNSLVFLLFKDIFLEKFSSVNEYCINNYVSYSFVYKKINLIRKFLRKYELTISKDLKIKGDEKQIRVFLSFIFEELYGQNFYLYPKQIQESTILFLKELEQINQKPLKEFSKISLYHYLSITLFRISKKTLFRKRLTIYY